MGKIFFIKKKQMEKLLGTQWLVVQLRNGKELNDELEKKSFLE